MNRLRISHRTGFHYGGNVATSYNEARMLPRTGLNQSVLSSELDILPVTAQRTYLDYWGSRVSAFEILMPHTELVLTATSVIEVREPSRMQTLVSWSHLARATEHATEYSEQLKQTILTQPPSDVIDIARQLADDSGDPSSAARDICLQIGESVEYQSGVTSVRTTAGETWNARRGVCQDIAHLTLGALRSVGIPARYVSGYLHPQPHAPIGKTVKGESHAWIEWFSGDQWRGFDPTNRVEVGGLHVVVGRGRDYNDVPPLRGVYAGPFTSSLFQTVEITCEARDPAA